MSTGAETEKATKPRALTLDPKDLQGSLQGLPVRNRGPRLPSKLSHTASVLLPNEAPNTIANARKRTYKFLWTLRSTGRRSSLNGARHYLDGENDGEMDQEEGHPEHSDVEGALGPEVIETPSGVPLVMGEYAEVRNSFPFVFV